MSGAGGANGSPAVYVSCGHEYVVMAFAGDAQFYGATGTMTVMP